MPKCGLSALLCLLPATGMAQVVCAFGGGAAYRPAEDKRPSADAMQLISRSFAAGKTVCGNNCPEVVLFRNDTAPNLLLTLASGQAKLVYAPQFMTAIYARHGDAGIMAVMDHMLGHAWDDVMGAAWIDKKWTAEQRADAWAGCILAKTSLPPSDIPAAMAALQENPPGSHPAWGSRDPAIRTGYQRCGGAALPDPPPETRQEAGTGASLAAISAGIRPRSRGTPPCLPDRGSGRGPA